MQTTSHILMIRPVHFAFNAQTAVNNAFQLDTGQQNIQDIALKEFDAFVDLQRSKGIDVMVVNDTNEPHTPDSIFPNNWISFHSNGNIVLYPMYAVNRRLERKPSVLEKIKQQFVINHTLDLSGFEKKDKFLEGTGSMVLDRDKMIAYACLSPRTDKELFENFCRQMNYQPVAFTATDKKGAEIYHTNVMMCVADKYVVICLDSIADRNEKKQVSQTIINSGKEIIEISPDQMNRFAGNMLQVNNAAGQKFLVMSTQAYNSLASEQLNKLNAYNEIIHSSLDTIESNGGGSARCMMAEVYLPLK
ncbi:MAG: amidinotransferase [Chitinophagaceae bacterium]|nr:amidinotransferase [Chitinophagaceae bacterium]